MSARWYIIHAHTGFEKRVAQQIQESAAQNGVTEKFEEIFVPSDEVTQIRKGKKVKAERKYFPGYVLVKMQLNDETWHIVKSVPKVTGFLGNNGKPQPISPTEVERIYNRIDEQAEIESAELSFEIGEEIKVVDGPFESFSGVVEDVEEDKKRLKVSVSIFGRATPVDLEYGQVEKIN